MALALAFSAVMLAPVFLNISLHPPRMVARFSPAELGRVLGQHPISFLAFAAIEALILPLRALQWSLFLPHRTTGRRTRYRAVALGALAQNVLPARAGELVPALSLSRDSQLGKARVLTTVAMSKLGELAAMLTVLIVGLHFLTLAPAAEGTLRLAVWAAGGGLALVAGAVAVIIHMRKRRPERDLAPVGSALRRRCSALIDELAHGAAACGSWQRLGWGYLASIGVIGLGVCSLTVALGGVSEPLSLVRGVILLGAINLGMSIPSAPSGVGVYHLVCVGTLGALGVDPLRAAAFALATHLLSVITHSSMGALELARSGSSAALAPAEGVPSFTLGGRP